MSSCGGKCNCGANCSCGSGCNCNSCGVEKVTSMTIVSGVAPMKSVYESFNEAIAEDGGCKCGANCKCDPCTC
ncbi:Metallothionein-like protein [Drosera capensis]